MTRIALFGATGSIGHSALEVLRQHKNLFSLEGATAYRSVETLAQIAQEFSPNWLVLGDDTQRAKLSALIPDYKGEILTGLEGLKEAACLDYEVMISAIVGAAGLLPTWLALEQGRRVALANKETLVCAGELIKERFFQNRPLFPIESSCASQSLSGPVPCILPVDSEHSALFQALQGQDLAAIERLILTASGGPFREWSVADMAKATPEQALNHPNWSMGARITIDSATMVNKGLELIEAHYLFGIPEEKIDVLVHPQSIVHSLVAYQDGSQMAQLGQPDMKVPLAYALSWPKRVPLKQNALDWSKTPSLEFATADEMRFPALKLAKEALKQGQSAPLVLNTADEIAVEAFLQGRLSFLEIICAIEAALGSSLSSQPLGSVEDVLALDEEVRVRTEAWILQKGKM